jgi:hypothetical protein
LGSDEGDIAERRTTAHFLRTNQEANVLRVRLCLATLVLVSLLPVLAGAQEAAAKKLDLTGKWLFSVTTDQGTGTPTVTLKQQGDSLTGHYSSQTLGEAALKGTVKQGKITFVINVSAQGSTFPVTYAGAMDGDTAMKGTVDLGGFASGTFTAKRQP